MDSYYKTDVPFLLSQIKHEDEAIKLKRRWLLGLPSSDAEEIEFQNPKFCDNASLPESLMREDDVFYERVRMFVEEASGACDQRHDIDQCGMQLLEISKIRKLVLSELDAFTIEGLCELAKVLGVSINIEKTRSQLKWVIKENFPRILESRDKDQLKICEQLSQLLTNPWNYKNKSHLTLKAHYYRYTISKIVDQLEDFSYQTLCAMYRKLKGKWEFTPGMHRPKQKNLGYVVRQVRKLIGRVLSQLDDRDDLPETLVKAMVVAGFALKLKYGSDNLMLKVFNRCSSDVKSLQNEIIETIKLVDAKFIKFPILKEMQLILEPDAKITNRSLRTAVKNVLTEYLFECCDMDSIPVSLTKTLALVKGRFGGISQRLFQEDCIQEEVESILGLSAQAKQIFLDLLPDYEFDQNFVDAYMENLEGSDDEADFCVCSQSNRLNANRDGFSSDLTIREESFGESLLPSLEPENNNLAPLPESNDRLSGCVALHEQVSNSGMDSLNAKANSPLVQELSCFSSILNTEKIHVDKLCAESMHWLSTPVANENGKEPNTVPSVNKNNYLSIQDICDKSSMFVYILVGRMLEEFGRNEGLYVNRNISMHLKGRSTNTHVQEMAERPSSLKDSGALLVKATQELLPSFTESGREKLMKLMVSED